MKHYPAVLAVLGAAICLSRAAPAGQPALQLRQVAAQSPASVSSFTPRQLSAEERAELRRQLSEYARGGPGKGS